MPATCARPLVVAAILVAATSSLFAQSTVRTPEDHLADLLVWGADSTPAITGLPPDLQPAVDRFRLQWDGYRSVEPRPSGPEMGMVFDARVRYERRLAAIGTGPNVGALARAYVAALRPCYEWEGFHECPEREALFADSYQAEHLNGPFAQYLPLLSAHRWLCAAEAYHYEGVVADERRSRHAYERALEVAGSSAVLLVRTAAQALKRRGRCFP